MQVQTTKGLIDHTELEVSDEVTLEENARVIATSWTLNGELVRRDVNVNILKSLSVFNEQNI